MNIHTVYMLWSVWTKSEFHIVGLYFPDRRTVFCPLEVDEKSHVMKTIKQCIYQAKINNFNSSFYFFSSHTLGISFDNLLEKDFQQVLHIVDRIFFLTVKKNHWK